MRLSINQRIKEYLSNEYEDITVHNDGFITGFKKGEPRRYSTKTNTGGRKFLGYRQDYIETILPTQA